MMHEDALDIRGSVAEVEDGHWESSMSVVGPAAREAGVGQWGRVGDSPRTPRGHSKALGIASTAKGRRRRSKRAMKACIKSW